MQSTQSIKCKHFQEYLDEMHEQKIVLSHFLVVDTDELVVFECICV
jgi:hypothetical protein